MQESKSDYLSVGKNHTYGRAVKMYHQSPKDAGWSQSPKDAGWSQSPKDAGWSMQSPKDAGWSWMVLVASFSLQMITVGVCLSSGLFIFEFMEIFHTSQAETVWIASMQIGVSYLIGGMEICMQLCMYVCTLCPIKKHQKPVQTS